MTEGIEYHELGTVDVTFDDKTYHLRRPKMRQFRYFTGLLEKATRGAADELVRLQRAVTDAKAAHTDETTPEAQAEIERLSAEVREFSTNPFYNTTGPIVAEMFAQLGDPLPDDPDDWPAWLAADSALPGAILNHWKTHPKASGTPPGS
jgi:hypothetical protein